MPSLSICFALLLATAAAQPFSFNASSFHAEPTEPRLRAQSGYEGVIFDFKTAKASDVTPNGMIQQNQASSNPFLSTLPGDGNGQTLVTMGPCAGNTPHTHPRGSEISFLLYGEISFGMVEENANGNQLIIRNMTQNTTFHVPQGVLHFSHNLACKPAAFLANFATKDPGTQTMWNSLLQVPTPALNAATGLSEVNIEQLKTLPLVVAPGTGGEECMRRCGLDFQKANAFHNVPPANTVAAPSVATQGRKLK
ncbi:hypothetical protein WJX72_002454 [[Myrmecia] bisecta]|uniref:Germin-like protein n=1 Tax=[Myrmecia] bisecta TaxID=41462 RepID=A0AAW1QQC0_9CHLO